MNDQEIKDLFDSEFITWMELSWRTGKSKEELLRILTDEDAGNSIFFRIP